MRKARSIRNDVQDRVAALVDQSNGELGDPSGMWNGVGDALRHAAASCEMSKEFGATTARTVLSNHENDESQPIGEQRMDARNNAVGQRLAKEGGDCLDAAVGAYRAGNLTTAPVTSQNTP